MIYCYNINTGEYSMTMPFETETGEGRTQIAPPDVGDNEVAVFDTETQSWTVYPDYRFTHKMELDGVVYNIENFGEIPENYTLITNTQAAEIEETARINNLTMTPLDFINVLQNVGLTLEEINAYLEANLSVGMQLKYCNSVYCGIAKSLMPITLGDITITADMIETAFKTKNGEE